jgi:hypothetical protein
MSMTFTKLFSSITASTIWAAPDHTRIVWITMLAMADQHGRVWASIPGLANIARVPIEATESALEELMSPDKYSRTKDNDGRRIEEIDGGWRLLNHAKYRAIRDEESIKQSKRAYINKRRAEERASKSVEQCRTESIAVDRGRANTEAEAEAEAEAEEKKEKATRKRATPPKRPEGVDPQIWEDWLQLRKAKRAPVTETVVAGAAAEAQKAGMPLCDFLAVWCRRGSQGLEAAWLKPEERSQGRSPPPHRSAGSDRIDRQLLTAGLMTGAIRPSEPTTTITTLETFDVAPRVIAA